MTHTHINLFRRLLAFSNKTPIFSANYSYLEKYLGISKNTVHIALNKLVAMGLIYKYTHYKPKEDGTIKTIQLLKINPRLSRYFNLECIKHKLPFSHLQNEKQTTSLPKKQRYSSIFEIRLKKQNYTIPALETANIQKFQNFHLEDGFQKWFKNKKQMTYQSIKNKSFSDKVGLFYNYREYLKKDAKSEKSKQEEKEIQAKEQMKNHVSELEMYHRELIMENWKNKIGLSDKEILDRVIQNFINDKRLELYLQLQKEVL